MRIDTARRVELADGSAATVGELVGAGPTAFVLMRHFGCVFCREQGVELCDLDRDDVVLVGLGSVADGKGFVERFSCKLRVVCDPDGALYREAEIPRGRFLQLASPRVLWRGVAATLKGGLQSRPTADPTQLPGAVIVSSGGEVLWRHVARDASDHPASAEVLDRLDGLRAR